MLFYVFFLFQANHKEVCLFTEAACHLLRLLLNITKGRTPYSGEKELTNSLAVKQLFILLQSVKYICVIIFCNFVWGGSVRSTCMLLKI